MTRTTLIDEDREAIHILAFASREFDRVRGLLVDEDEPGEEEVASAVSDSPDDAHGATADKPSGDEASDGETSRGGGVLDVARRTLGAVTGAARAAGRLATGSVHPRHDDWAAAPLSDRIDWWVQRFGTAAAALAAVPGLAGRLGRITAAGDVVGASAQVLVVNAVAREMGVTDIDERVVTAARVVLDRDLDPRAVAEALAAPAPHAPDATDEAGSEQEANERAGGTSALGHVGRTARLIWSVANRVRVVRSDLGNRPQGNVVTRAVSNVPGVGAAGAFLSERAGIRRAADAAHKAFEQS